MAHTTVREALRIKIDRLQARRARHLADAQACLAEIELLREQRDALVQAQEDLLLRLQELGVIEAKD